MKDSSMNNINPYLMGFNQSVDILNSNFPTIFNQKMVEWLSGKRIGGWLSGQRIGGWL